MALTAARVDMTVLDSGDWSDAFQLGTVGDTSWNLVGATFHMDVKGSTDDTSPLFQLNSANGRIVVDDTVQRIIHFNAVKADIQAALIPGLYVYDLVMIAASGVRTPLMYGRVKFKHGATQE